VEASTSTSPEKRVKNKLDDFWLNAEELPGEGNIYGGIVLLPDGRRASIYLEMGKKDIKTLEANIIDVRIYGESGLEKTELILTEIIISEEELQQEITVGTRTMTVKRYIFEEVIPYYYNQKKGKP